MITCSDLSVHKAKNILLDKISFSIKTGAICGLLGPSGAGKTTLMRTLVGLQIPTGGGVAVLDSKPGSCENRKRIGYVTQSPSIYSDLTIMQNLAYFGRLLGAEKSAVSQALEKVQLQPQAKQIVATLSGGQKTRASLAVALLGDPELLIMDEPTVGLDPILRKDLWRLFKIMAGRAGPY